MKCVEGMRTYVSYTPPLACVEANGITPLAHYPPAATWRHSPRLYSALACHNHALKMLGSSSAAAAQTNRVQALKNALNVRPWAPTKHVLAEPPGARIDVYIYLEW